LTHRLEDGSLLVAATKWPHVVHGNTTLLLEKRSIQATVGHLGNPLICAIFGRFEEERGGPVVAEILAHLARRALGQLRGVHGLGVHLIFNLVCILSRNVGLHGKEKVRFIPSR